MRIAVGSDHAGFTLKEQIRRFLEDEGHEVVDVGTHSEEAVDYPPICAAAARQVASGLADRAMLFGGSGQGEQIAANKVHGIRASLCHDLFTARLARAHNDANVLTMGGRIVAPGLAKEIARVWLATSFDGGRHARRVEQIGEIEREER